MQNEPHGGLITRPHLAKIPALDGLRALAAVAVVAFHARIPGFAMGAIGVDVFFVLSGFLITTILIPTGPGTRTSLREFYRRRALRLLPAYIAVVVACVLAEEIVHAGGTLKAAAASSLYAANWTAAAGMGGGTLYHTWSLSIEEQFYLVWPLLFAWLLARCRWDGKRVLIGIGAMIAAAWALTATLTVSGAPSRVAWNATPTRGIEILVGAALAITVATPVLWTRVGRMPRHAGMIAGVGLFALVPVVVPVTPEMLVGWPVIAVLTSAVIVACVQGAQPASALLGSRALVAVGKRSYGLYLWHFPIFVIIDTRWGLDSWTAKTVGLAVTAIVVTASYRFLERPFLNRKDGRARVRQLAEPVPAPA